MHTRRSFLAGSAGLWAFSPSPDPWREAAAILKRIQPPRFPGREFVITEYGAARQGDSTTAIRAAIEACARMGGGYVIVPAGTFETGAIHLKSGVNLHLARGATLKFSTDPKQYLPAVFTRWEGTECMGYSPLIYAFEQQNIAVTGEGTLDGQAGAAHWWPWKGIKGAAPGGQNQNAARRQLLEAGEKGVPVAERLFADGSYLRPQFVQTYRCRNVLIEGVTIVNSPMWEIHPALCRNVTVRGVKVSSHGPNNDGCDPESSRDVLIEDCVFDTGDDCIAIKSGRNNDGRRVAAPCENIIVRGCRMKDGHGGVTIGSEVSGGIRNVFAERCRMDSPHLDRALRIKTNAQRGGVVEGVYLRDIEVGQVSGAAIDIDFLYEEGAKGPHAPVVRNVRVERMTCRKSKSVLFLRGFEHSPIRGLRVSESTFENAAGPDTLQHVEGLEMRQVRVNGKAV